MPTVLNGLVDELGAGLDEKALSAIQQVDAVSALAFLHRIHESTGQVRNPSAFIATAVRNAQGRGPGPRELESALARLTQDNTLDDNAMDALKKGRLEESVHALNSFLTQDAASVRNASAYVTRNISNARKQPMTMMMQPVMTSGGPMMAMQGMSMMSMGGGGSRGSYQGGGGGGSMSAAGEALLSKWGSQLDDKAKSALSAVGGAAATAILHEMDSKGANVRNPSAYISRAVANRKEEGGGGPIVAVMPSSGMGYNAAPMGFMPMMGGMGGMAMGGGGKGGAGRRDLDKDAMEALSKVSETQAAAILANLESRSATVRNPSAYVVRSVKNFMETGEVPSGDFAPSAPRTSSAGQSYNYSSTPEPQAPSFTPGNAFESLDERARNALTELPNEAAEVILQQLEAAGGKINNPSAYVLRSVSNARQGKGKGGEVANTGLTAQMGMTEELAKLSKPLDEKAMSALEELGPAAATAILQKLNKQGDTVNNPNAYVMRAVGNEKRGPSAMGGQPVMMMMGPPMKMMRRM